MGKSDVGKGKITSGRVLGILGGSIQPSSSLRSISPNKRIHVSEPENSCFREFMFQSQRKLPLVQEERGALVEEKVGGGYSETSIRSS